MPEDNYSIQVTDDEKNKKVVEIKIYTDHYLHTRMRDPK